MPLPNFDIIGKFLNFGPNTFRLLFEYYLVSFWKLRTSTFANTSVKNTFANIMRLTNAQNSKLDYEAHISHFKHLRKNMLSFCML